MTENPTTNPVRVLRDAADYLEANGWTQGKFFDFLENRTQPPAACAMGAIQYAVAGDAIDLFAVDYDSRITDQQIRCALEAAGIVVGHLRQQHDTARLGSCNASNTLAVWNDRPGRTAADVYAALREAADRHEREAS